MGKECIILLVYLQGRVQFPTGGKVRDPYARKADLVKFQNRRLKSGRKKMFFAYILPCDIIAGLFVCKNS